MNRWIVTLAAALLTVGTAYAGDDRGQGKGQGQGQGQAQGQGNHGQVVSECNHRANDRNLKGQDRKDYTEWCESRGGRYGYDDGRYNRDRECYQKAYKKGLSGQRRSDFLNNCLDGDPSGKKDKGGKDRN
jgi:hypothetical protein